MSDAISMSTTNTTIIDNKKKSTSTSNNMSNYLTFVKKIARIIIYVIIYFVIGSLMLYCCKISQANILPTSKPYDQTPTGDDITIFNFKDKKSMKISFPSGQTNTLIDFFSNYTTDNSNSGIKYFATILISSISFNYSVLNESFNFLNQLPEMVILLLGPILMILISVILFIMNEFYFCYLWFIKLFDFSWKLVNLIYIFLFVMLFFLIFPILLLIPIIIFVVCLFSLFTYNSVLNNTDATSITIISNVFKYHKILIISTILLFMLSTCLSTIGITETIFLLLTIILIYFNVIPIHLFQSIEPDPSITLIPTSKKNVQYKRSGDMSGGGRSSNRISANNFKRNLIKITNKINKNK